MEHVMKYLLIVAFTVQQVSAATHSLQYIITAVTPGVHFPEYTEVGLMDGEQFMYYDSNIRRYIPKTEWIKKVDADDPDCWNTETQSNHATQEIFKVNLATAMQRFNQTGGVHTVQGLVGCELYDDGSTRGYSLEGYDGEDFLSLDLNTLTWTAAKPQAVLTKQKWEREGVAARRKVYVENMCIEWLKKYVEYGRDTLERKVPPEVSVFQKDSSSPVVCHATGFFPKPVMIYWQKNGEDLVEDVEIGETLRNQDGTFQKRSILTVSPEELDKHNYTCIIQHSSLEKEMVLQGIDQRVLSGGALTISVPVVVGVLLSSILCAGVLILWKCVRTSVPPEQTPLQPPSTCSVVCETTALKPAEVPPNDSTDNDLASSTTS